MWEHPLLRKYEDHPLLKNGLSIGPAPPLPLKVHGKVVSGRQDIDMEILRSLQTLWHAVDPEILVRKLLSNESNHEKVFYRTLQKFRDAQLEASGEQPLKHSSSDYHHAPVAHTKGLYTPPQSWQGSRISLAGGNSYAKDGGYQVPSSMGTISTYDPYRFSQTPTPNPRAEYANVTIHRRPSRVTDSSPFQSPNSVQHSSRDQSLTPGPPSSYSVMQGFGSQKTSLASFRSYSSLGSSRYRQTYGPKHISHKRNVSFRHLHKSPATPAPSRNGASRSNSQFSLYPGKQIASQTAGKTQGQGSNRLKTPSLPTPPFMARKRRDAKNQENLVVANSRFSWREDTRKVSAELEKLCEEAFNQVSDSSSITKDSESKELSDTPSTSTSELASISSNEGPEPKVEAVKDLLPKQPQELPRTYAALELAEARRRLVEHSSKAGADGLPDYLKNVIAHLDRLIDGETANSANKPMTKQTLGAREPTGRLPVISEENHHDTDSKTFLPPHELTKPLDLNLDNWEFKKSIRIVKSDSTKSNIDVVKPLTVRKKPKAELSALDYGFNSFGFSGCRPVNCNEDNTISPKATVSRHDSGLNSVEEDPTSARSSAVRSSGETKKWGWFKHRRSGDDAPIKGTTKEIGAREYRTTFQIKKSDDCIHELANDIDGTDVASTISDADSKPNDSGVELDDDSTAATTPSRKNSADIPLTIGYANTWFSKFLPMTPASKVFALNISKPRAKKEILKILKEWKKYGLEELHLDKQNDKICGSVGELNFLRLRPVQFSAEFFSVLEHGRHANLSLIRLRQNQGASSSFYKVIQTLRMVLKRRDYLIQDSRRAKKMIKVLS
ncbi:hypothetical protein FQN49_006702 [Arthroderma sp. PD_2]|nr:hypothetical protein FQN49_006702 [Arthroderma sp. PD_2]